MSAASTPKAAVDAWYGEMALYASRTNNYANNPPDNLPSDAPETGHFSQMIWNGSTSLGCAMASNCKQGMATQVTCLYEPAGTISPQTSISHKLVLTLSSLQATWFSTAYPNIPRTCSPRVRRNFFCFSKRAKTCSLTAPNTNAF